MNGRSAFRSLVRRVRSRPWQTVAVAVLVPLGLLNFCAYQHVRAMTRFSAGGRKTLPPERTSVFGRGKVLLTGVNVPRPENSRSPEDMALPFSVERCESTNGIELEAWYVPAEEPRAIVALFPGYASAKSGVLPDAQVFHGLGCAALLIDFRGCGGSDGHETTVGYREADDVAAACRLARRLAPGAPLLLFGRSMGSVAILRAIAVAGVRPAGIILECPFDSLLGTVRRRFHAMGVPSFPGAELMVFWGSVQQGTSGFSHRPVDYAAHVTCPALVMQGDRDTNVTLGDVQAICDSLAGEHTLEVFNGIGHEPYNRDRPQQWERCVRAFLDRNVNPQYPQFSRRRDHPQE